MTSKTKMLSLVRDLNWKEIKIAINENPDLLCFTDPKGRSWLHICCSVDIGSDKNKIKDSIKTAEILIDAGIDINQPAFTEGSWKATPLWYSIGFGRNLPLSEYLLKHGSEPDHCLWIAANNNDAGAIRLLSGYGALDLVTNDASPFLAAVQWNKFAAAEEFLKHGADVNFQDSKKMTALHYLLRKSMDKKYILMLIKYGARGDIKNKNDLTAREIMMRKRDSDFHKMAAQLKVH